MRAYGLFTHECVALLALLQWFGPFMRTQASNRLPISPSCPPTIGSKLDGRYQLTRLLASGTLGLVYEGVDMQTGMEAAVKLFPSWVFQGEARERFLREAKRLASVRHPNLVRYLGFGLIGERSPFLAMERLRGITLQARLRQVGLLPARSCLRVLGELLRGLAAAHELKAPHRNIRPESVFLDRRGAVLFDFSVGLDSEERERLALEGSDAVGPEHSVWEPALAEEAAQLRSDLYAVSAMAYEMLTGRPVRTRNEHDSRVPVDNAAADGLRPPSALQSPIDPEVDRWVMRGLCEDASMRFTSAREMGVSCERLLEQLGG